MIGADALLEAYAEDLSILGKPSSQRLTLHLGDILESKWVCTKSPGCQGHARKEADGWKCSKCRKPWPSEPAELGVKEIGRQKPNRRGFELTKRHTRLLQFGKILDQVEAELPWEFLAWTQHVIGPGSLYERQEGSRVVRGTTPMRGIPIDRVADRLGALIEEGLVHGLPAPITTGQVVRWVAAARRRTFQLVATLGLE